MAGNVPTPALVAGLLEDVRRWMLEQKRKEGRDGDHSDDVRLDHEPADAGRVGEAARIEAV
jgi:hypothetical protein